MADEGSQQRKPDLRSAVEDVKALATVLVMNLETVLGRRLKLRSPAVLAAIGVVATLVLAVAVVMVLLRTGGAGAVSDNAGLIGVLVALGGVFTAQMVGISLDDRRAQQARELEAQRAHEAALQNYLNDVGELVIEKPLQLARPGDKWSAVVRAQTLSVLQGLEPDRKGILLQFLYESGLIQTGRTVISLVGANLFRANLSGANLSFADLSWADLREANVRGGELIRSDLTGADLREANLSGAYLHYASLRGADLRGADLSEHLLDEGVVLRDEAALRDEADLLGADLFHANLSGAYLHYANLSGANLKGADLSWAQGITKEELEQQAAFLEGAIMPDGSKHP